jgi:beta-1,4-mannosyltransferase
MNNGQPAINSKLRVVAYTAFAGRLRNPYNWLLYSNMKTEVKEFVLKSLHCEECDVLHIHWPESSLNSHRSSLIAYIRLRLLLFRIDQYTSRGARLIWTLHNLRSHEGFHPRLEAWFWREFINRLHGVIALSESGLEAALRKFPALSRLPSFVIRHGHYRDAYPNDADLDARSQLGIDSGKQVILFFGQIRSYKNIPRLLEAFRNLRGDEFVLYIAGMALNRREDRLIEDAAASDPRVRLHLDHVPQDQVQVFFRAADLVVLPFRDILNSGTAILSLSLDRPILVPARGAMGELQQLAGHEWVRTYDGELSESELAGAINWATKTVRAKQSPLQQLEWPHIAAQTLEAYRNTCNLVSGAR